MATRTTAKTAAKKKPAARAKAESPPWERANPKGDRHQHLDAKAKAGAKRRAQAAGRPYPNLVDNMRAAAKAKK